MACQSWLIYPDDANNLRKVLKKAGLKVFFTGDRWEITSGEALRSKVKKDFTIVRDGPFRGARVEPVLIKEPFELTDILKKCGIFIITTRQSEDTMYVFIGFNDRKAVYAKRINNI